MLNSLTKLGRKVGTHCRANSTLPPPQRNPKLPPSKLFINNEWVEPLSKKKIPSFSPVNGELVTEIAYASKEDVDVAVAAARKAFDMGSPWRTMDASKRGILINRLADLIERDIAIISSLEALECGKVYTATLKGDVVCGIKSLRYFAGYADKNDGTMAEVDGNFLAYCRYEPVGVVGNIVAWNFSNFVLCLKLAPTLAAGCTTVLKPSQHSTLATLHIAGLAKEAGFPPGVINVVTGPGAVGSTLVEHLDVDCISFTGSTPVGQDIYRKAGVNMKRLVLQLGGKSPNIILKDANVDEAVEHAHYASFHNMGQCCCAGSRTYVHEDIYENFVQKMRERVSKKKTGDPFDLTVDHGPQATKEQADIIMKYINIGKEEGAKLEIGGDRIEGPGCYIQPTVFSDVTDDMTIAREEIFGPVMQILPYKSTDDILARANDSPYGLASSVFGKDIDEINTLVRGIRAGNVWVNCYFLILPQLPFGGFKMSGIGRECGRDGIKAFSEVKSVYMRTPTKSS